MSDSSDHEATSFLSRSPSRLRQEHSTKFQHNSKDGGLKNKWERAPNGHISYFSLEETFCDQNDNNSPCELNELQATSIAGNDITGSCLYTCGLVLRISGVWGVLCFIAVSCVLHIFRVIYSEVGSALPLNGGTYNALLNTVSKKIASLAACLTILSYTATAVVSASSAAEYIDFLAGCGHTNYISLGILSFFALLTLLGLKDSANVATCIFVAHMMTLASLSVAALFYIIDDRATLLVNNVLEDLDMTSNFLSQFAHRFFFGFGAALLGISGFESSANYIEEQKEGVFPKTLRNMWCAITIFNPLLTFLSIGVIKLNELQDNNFSNTMLAHVALRCGGQVLRYIFVIDAVLVLAAGVLTSFVGVNGLVCRMALDRCLPRLLLNTNKLRGSYHFIILSFLLITSSLRIFVRDMETLGGVFALAFLSVMFLFCVSNILLKYKRTKLPRSPIASYPTTIFAAKCTFVGIVSNIMISEERVKYFCAYATVTLLLVFVMFGRVQILRILLHITSESLPTKLRSGIENTIHDIRSMPLIFFAKDPSLPILNKAILYTQSTEDTNTVIIVHAYQIFEHFYHEQNHTYSKIKDFEEAACILDRLYPKLSIQLLLIKAEFNSALIQHLSTDFGIPKNYMFVCCPGDKFPYSVRALGGVRIIMH